MMKRKALFSKIRYVLTPGFLSKRGQLQKMPSENYQKDSPLTNLEPQIKSKSLTASSEISIESIIEINQLEYLRLLHKRLYNLE